MPKTAMLNPKERISYIGRVYGELTIIDLFKKHGPDSRFRVKCSCGNESVLYLREILERGQCSICREMENVTNRIQTAVTRNGVTADKIITKRMQEYKIGAKQRGYPFELTREQFTQLITSDCHYCGIPPNRTRNIIGGTFSYLGIDRVNNNWGYILSNCVSCCWECNKLKGTMSYNEFTAYLDRVAAYRGKQNC